jgi:anti-anti-sigma factor
MNTAIFPEPAVVVAANEIASQTELIRDRDNSLLERMIPLVCRESVSLDLSPVRRIDAAGIAALVKLYRAARETGHNFTLFNVAPRVAQILALVGLDGILLEQGKPQRGSRFRPSAA